MNRRAFMTTAAAGAALRPYAARSPRPNVLFLMSDEHSGRVMGCAGDGIVQTPTLDALAASGVRFSAAYCQNPICVPSRASLVTGRMPSNVGVFGNDADEQDVLRDTPVSMARSFAAAGYTVEWLGKEHWGTDNAGLGFGRENERVQKVVKQRSAAFLKLRKQVGRLPQKARGFGPDLQPDEDAVVADEAVRCLERYDGTQPFFLGVSLKKPHFPFLVEQRFLDLYQETIDLPDVTSAMLENLPEVNRRHREKYHLAAMTDAQIRHARATYYGMISFIDDELGKVLRALEANGLRDNTVVVYLSDHGDQAGHHGLWYKNSFYEDSVHVPLIWSWPGRIPRRQTVDDPVMLLDVFPSLCELCGIALPPGLEGISLVPGMHGAAGGARAVVSESYSSWKNPGRMVRRGPWKYCWYQDGQRQLYHLGRDPEEADNLAGLAEHEKRIEELHRMAMEGFRPHPSVRKG